MRGGLRNFLWGLRNFRGGGLRMFVWLRKLRGIEKFLGWSRDILGGGGWIGLRNFRWWVEKFSGGGVRNFLRGGLRNFRGGVKKFSGGVGRGEKF